MIRVARGTATLCRSAGDPIRTLVGIQASPVGCAWHLQQQTYCVPEGTICDFPFGELRGCAYAATSVRVCAYPLVGYRLTV